MYASRVMGRQMLLENPMRESRAKRERDEKRARQKALREKKKLGVIGKREAKEKGVWAFDKSQAKCVRSSHISCQILNLSEGSTFFCLCTTYG